MIYFSASAIKELHARTIKHSGGDAGIRDESKIDLALEQPRKTLAGLQVYASLYEKATALGVSILQNRPFIDGNKRVAHFALATFLRMNGFDIIATVDEQEKVMLALANNRMDPKHFVAWLRQNSVSMSGSGK